MRRSRPVLLSVVALVALTGAGCTSGDAARSGGPSSSAGSVTTPVPATPTPPPVSTTPTPSHRSSTRPASSPAAPSGSSASRSSAPAGRPTGAPVSYTGLTVVLNPGHNGGNASHPAAINRQVPAGYGERKACDTTGTNTDAGYAEHAFNWSVAEDVAVVLRAHGVHVVMTRPNDTGVGPCVDERAAIGNRAGVAAVVSIHADGAPSSGHGFHVNQASRRPDGASAATARRSDALGRAIHQALVSSSGLVPSTYIGQDGYYYRSDLAGLNMATRPATFLELGNMRNSADAARQSSAAGRRRIGRAIAAGILAYLASSSR